MWTRQDVSVPLCSRNRRSRTKYSVPRCIARSTRIVKLRTARSFAVSIDGPSDVSTKEMCVIYISYVGETDDAHASFLALVRPQQ